MIATLLVFVKGDPEAAARYAELIAAGNRDVTVLTAMTVEELQERLPKADALIAFGSHLPKGVLAGASRLKWIQSLGTGVDGIVDQPGLPESILITATRGIHGAPMSEHAILSMLALARDLPKTLDAQRRGSWERWRMKTLAGKTVGILGSGAIAAALAPRCKALGMRVVGISRSPRPVPSFDAMHALSELKERIPEFDFFVLLIPYSAETRHIVGSGELAAMKPASFLINLARGGIVDEEALLPVLKERRIAGAALDVMNQEPLPPEHPLWKLDNVIITPHIGGYYDGYADDASVQVNRNLARLTRGAIEELENRVR